jgi:hypothetical protein
VTAADDALLGDIDDATTTTTTTMATTATSTAPNATSNASSGGGGSAAGSAIGGATAPSNGMQRIALGCCCVRLNSVFALVSSNNDDTGKLEKKVMRDIVSLIRDFSSQEEHEPDSKGHLEDARREIVSQSHCRCHVRQQAIDVFAESHRCRLASCQTSTTQAIGSCITPRFVFFLLFFFKKKTAQ